MSTVIRRFTEAFSLSAAIFGVTIIGQIVAVPVYLSRWGAPIYGEWLVLTNLGASLSVLNLGVQSYVANLLVMHHVRGEINQGKRILHAAVRLYSVLCCIVLAATVTLVLMPGLPRLLRIQAISPTSARWILAVQGCNAACVIIFGLCFSLFRVTLEYPRQLRYGLLERISVFLAPVSVATAGGSALHASAISMIMSTVIGGAGIRDVSRRSPFSIGFSETSWREAWRLVIPSLSFFAATLCASLVSSGMLLLLSTTSGSAAVVLFSTLMTLSNAPRVLIGHGMNVLWAEITAVSARDSGRLLVWHRLLLKICTFVSIMASAGLVLLGPAIVAEWTRHRIQVDVQLNLLLAVYLVLQIPGNVSTIFGLALNKQGEVLQVQAAAGLSAFCLAAALITFLGVHAVAWALIMSQTAATVWMLSRGAGWTSDTFRRLLGDGFVRGLPTLGVTVLILTYAHWRSLGLAANVLAALLTGAIGSVTAWRYWFTQADRELLISKVVIPALHALGLFREERIAV